MKNVLAILFVPLIIKPGFFSLIIYGTAIMQYNNEVIQFVTNILSFCKSVQIVALSGSYTQNISNKFSDIDFIVYLDKIDYTSLNSIYSALKNRIDCISCFINTPSNICVLSSNGECFDINIHDIKYFNSQSHLLKCKILYNKNCQNYKYNVRKLDDFDAVNFNLLNFDQYIWNFFRSACEAKTAEFNDHRSYEKLRSSIDRLTFLRNNYETILVLLHGKKEYLKLINNNIVYRLSCCYPRFISDEVIESLLNLLNLYINIIPDLEEVHDKLYVLHKFKKLQKLIFNLVR